MFKKVLTGGAIVGFLLVNVAFAQNSTSTNQDLLAVIKQLQAEVQSLQVQIADLQNQIQSVRIELNFTRALAKGASGDDVKQLQEFLKTLPDIYPEGLVTGYFGPLTEEAVKKLQEENGIESIGIVGPKTQAKLTELATTGAGQSGVIKTGLASAGGPPSSTPSGTVPAIPAIPTTPAIPATSSTPAMPAVPATPATPASPGGGGGGSPPPPPLSPSPTPSPTPTPSPSPTPTSTTSDTTPPSTPANLSASAVSTSQINLSWSNSTDNVGVAGYKIYRGGAQIATSAAPAASTTLSYSDTGLQASTFYTYAVAAYDAAGNTSAQSNQASTTTQANPVATTAYPVCDQAIKNVPGGYSSIQAAINAAISGDTVKVAAGTYNENLTMKSGVCLEGAGVDQTIITKSGAPGITIDGVSYVIIKNLTVKNSGCQPGPCGGGGDGGGIRAAYSNNIMLDSCRLTGNSVVNGGGIIADGTTNLTVSSCLIDNNHVGNAGSGVLVEVGSSATLNNVTVVSNVAGSWAGSYMNGNGGGLYTNSPTVVSNSIIWGNTMVNGASSNLVLVGSGLSISNSDIGGWSGGTGNISIDPLFVSTTDYHLQSSSTAAGMGVYP